MDIYDALGAVGPAWDGDEMVRSRARPLVGAQPRLTVGAITLAGGFQPGPDWASVEEGRFQVRRHGDLLQVRFEAVGGARVVEVQLQRRKLPRGWSWYLLCPFSGAPSLKLFLAGDRLGSWRALGLDHLSHARPKAYKVSRPKLASSSPLGDFACATEDGWQGPMGPEREQAWIQALARSFHKAQANEIASTRSHTIWDWGFSIMAPKLDCKALQRLRLLEDGRRHVGEFIWPDKLGAIDSLLVATDLGGRHPPMMLLRIVSSGEIVHQAITLIRRGARWSFRCPVAGELTSTLYGRAGRFASLKAQLLVHGLDRPPGPDDDQPLIAENWRADAIAPFE